MSSRPASSSRRISLRRISGSSASGCCRVVVQQPLPVARQAEEVVLLPDPLRRPLVHRTGAVHQVLLLLERLARDAVPPFVEPLVHVARFDEARHQRRDPGAVARLRRPDEVVERDVETAPDLPEHRLHFVAERQRLDAQLARLGVDVLRVLVVAHQKAGLDAAQPLVAGDHVGGDLLVGRAQMRAAVDVVDCRRQVKFRHRITCRHPARPARRAPAPP